jgi:hypothetical protein
MEYLMVIALLLYTLTIITIFIICTFGDDESNYDG